MPGDATAGEEEPKEAQERAEQGGVCALTLWRLTSMTSLKEPMRLRAVFSARRKRRCCPGATRRVRIRSLATSKIIPRNLPWNLQRSAFGCDWNLVLLITAPASIPNVSKGLRTRTLLLLSVECHSKRTGYFQRNRAAKEVGTGSGEGCQEGGWCGMGPCPDLKKGMRR